MRHANDKVLQDLRRAPVHLSGLQGYFLRDQLGYARAIEGVAPFSKGMLPNKERAVPVVYE